VFDVHLFAVVRIKFSHVSAVCVHDAVRAAIERFDSSDFLKLFDGESTEFADEFSHFLVDLVGDAEFEQSRFVTSRQEPLVALLEKLVGWDASDRLQTELSVLLAEARRALEWSV
jgi:hypothetical protein